MINNQLANRHVVSCWCHLKEHLKWPETTRTQWQNSASEFTNATSRVNLWLRMVVSTQKFCCHGNIWMAYSQACVIFFFPGSFNREWVSAGDYSRPQHSGSGGLSRWDLMQNTVLITQALKSFCKYIIYRIRAFRKSFTKYNTMGCDARI